MEPQRALGPQLPAPDLPPNNHRGAQGPGAPPPANVTLKFDDNGSCRIHSAKRGEASVSDADKEIVTNERYAVMLWKVVNMHGKNGENDKHVTL